jgi:hypothetical protein
MAGTFRGGCFCGAVRFELTEILDAGYCHCSNCRRFSGAPLLVWANAPGHAAHVQGRWHARSSGRRSVLVCSYATQGCILERRLTPPSSGRPPAGCAGLRSPLMSNVRQRQDVAVVL